MPQTNAGILLFRRKPHLQLLLAHPGSPMWRDKTEDGGWIIPSARVKSGGEPIETARRQFEESFGFLPDGVYLELGSVTENEGETIHVWATEYDLPEDFVFEPYWFEMEWPPGSGQFESFPEMDRIEYFNPFEARNKILPVQRAFISRLIDTCSRTER